MGVVTWANLKIEYQPRMDKVLLAPVYDLDHAIEFLYRVLRLRIGQECLLLNRVNLASIIAESWPADFERLSVSLPPWILIMVISGLQRRPEEKIRYEEETLGRVMRDEFPAISLRDSLPGFPGLGKKTLSMLRKPWPRELPYWKNRYQGGCQSLFFITRPILAPEFIDQVALVAAQYGYPINDIGGYIQPIEHNRACQLEFSFFYDPGSPSGVDRVRSLYHEAARVLFDEGALFTRPYGELAQLVFDKAAGYTMALRRLKRVFDPNSIMNPGALCF
jgi:hypothetical protein